MNTLDHELDISAFTARGVASGGSTPYSVVAAGLHAHSGIRHGGESLRVEAALQR
ncbi:MAG: citrate/2-methylcitrate synthase [Vicinamibacteria bacterium]